MVLGHRGGRVIAFWWAYIVTRPLRASIADWVSKPAKAGALAYGDGPVAAAPLVTALILVTYIAVRRAAGNSPEAEPPASPSKSPNDAETTVRPVHPAGSTDKFGPGLVDRTVATLTYEDGDETKDIASIFLPALRWRSLFMSSPRTSIAKPRLSSAVCQGVDHQRDPRSHSRLVTATT